MEQPILELDHVTYSYPGVEGKPAVNDLSYKVYAGEWIAIIGHNGSGKSTSAKLINGLLAADFGQIKVDGEVLSAQNIWKIRRKIGMVFQNPDNQFVGATVEDDVAFGMENIGVSREKMQKRVRCALEEVRMSAFLKREPARLSGGQKQRVALAGVIALSPKILILDEATSMLDPKGRTEVLQTVKRLKEKKNLTVLSITHDLDEAASADRLFVMKDGVLLDSGKPEAIFAQDTRLIEWGLDLPFSIRLSKELQKHGIKVPPGFLTEERLVDWLWTSILKK
ncbi:MAG: energy-coupling factor ABC transporter ATP-binding protein [Lactobacillales bacterium]|jgi:energy-coupling factor transport system ATP-binding protein|nr:energy-coupling factor ABC transporter ATP-binding protein [Lactobacillales bacterium]